MSTRTRGSIWSSSSVASCSGTVLTCPHGEVGNWLVGEEFDLKEPRSLQGEQAIGAAQALMDAASASTKAIADADQALRKAGLPDIDPFWVQWGYFKKHHTVASTKKSAAKHVGKPRSRS